MNAAVTCQDIYEQLEWLVGHLVIEQEEIKIFIINLKTLSSQLTAGKDYVGKWNHLAVAKCLLSAKINIASVCIGNSQFLELREEEQKRVMKTR
ncbi:hypothetical protein T03_13222 [Trichinella britovi]|uniref:Uncharacterized protein n=1 Tax=Trichinella britovi TaxID=45882 RepID=A0A0V1C7B2_TRIBR|nr:hypothetical protein T03_13222 [Trichinella britovi]